MKYFITTTFLLVSSLTIAQNTFPTSGNAGIGTTGPSNLLTVQGMGALGSTFQQKITNGSQTLALGVNSTAAEVQSQGAVPLYLNYGGNNLIMNATGGYVGIGTTSPQATLHVNGTTFLGTPGSQFYVASGYTFFSSQAGIRNNGGDVVFNSQTGGTLYLNRDITGDTRIQSSSTDLAVFLRNGNVGIGTSTPSTKLSVSGGAIMNSDPTYSGINVRLSGSDVPGLNFSRDLNGSQTYYHNASVGQFYNSTAGQYSLGFSTGISSTGDQNANTLAMTVMLNGNVGIGTTSPDAKLAVSGQVHAQEVKVSVTVPGPDYVFEKDYQLTSLEYIKTYIEENKHLPEVPSAKEMEKNGVQLGEMNMLLLKKIEELTLYVIEQNKLISKQNERIVTLENKK